MNFNIDIVSANYLPVIAEEGVTNPFVEVYQVGLKKTKIGVTNAFPSSNCPRWNQRIPAHGLRGMSFFFEIYHYRQNGHHVLIGTAGLNQENLVLGAQQNIPVIAVNDPVHLRLLPNPTLTVSLSMIPNVSPVPSPFQNQPIPCGQIVYFNLAFADAYEPEFPIRPSLGSDTCPLDLTFLAFNPMGAVRAISFNAECHICEGISHSGKILTRGYDTMGPTIRMSVNKLFTGQLATQRAVVVVNCTSEKRLLNSFKWIAVDVYTSNEKLNAMDTIPCFYKRFVIPPCPGTIAAAFTIDPSPSGLIFGNVQWFAPNAMVPFPPVFACEVTPELAELCGFDKRMSKRRTACLPYKPASIARAISICGYPPNSPMTAGAGWKGKADLDLACISLDSAMNMRSICFYNNRNDFGGAIMHYGDNRTGTQTSGDDETLGFQLAMLPPDIHYLALTLTCFKGGTLDTIKGTKLSLYVNGCAEIYRLDTRYPQKAPGLLFLVIYRSSPTEWSMYPMVSYSLEGVSPVKILPFVQSEIRRTFY